MGAWKLWSAGLALAGPLTVAGHAGADEITLRIASGHPPAVVYAGLMQSYFQPELKKQIGRAHV